MADRRAAPGFPQDLAELFDIVDADGHPLGYAKPRGDVHRDGDWHRSVHIWVYGVRGDVPFLLFQRRGLMKDTAPGRLDPTVSGHVGQGESIHEAWREVDEEIGVAAVPSELRFAGVRVRSSEGETGIIDREIQDVYLWRRDAPLEDYVPNPAELSGLAEIGLMDIFATYAGRSLPFDARMLDAETHAVAVVRLEPSEIAPSVDRYPYRVAVAVLAALRGDEWIAV